MVLSVIRLNDMIMLHVTYILYMLLREHIPRENLYFRISQYNDITISLYHGITISQYHDIMISRYHDITESWYHGFTISLYDNIMVSRYHNIMISQYHDQIINNEVKVDLRPWHCRAPCHSGRQCCSRSCRSRTRSPRRRCRSRSFRPVELSKPKVFIYSNLHASKVVATSQPLWLLFDSCQIRNHKQTNTQL